MDRLIAEQEDVINSIRRAVINFKKIGQKNYTPASTRNRLAILQEQWSRCQQLHAEIKITASTQDRATLSYFLDESFSVAEQEYYEASDLFSEVLEKLVKPVAISTLLLLIIPELPKFSGVYTEWSNFRDLFESLVASNESLSNVQRLHYLKSSLTGQAQLVIKNITITDANYEVAWTALKRRYENLRAIVAFYVNIILDVAPMKSDSVTELRRVHDTINDSFAVLCNMERSTINDFMVTITARKLDLRTRRDWEINLGSTFEPPTFANLSDFLISRIVALDAANDMQDISLNKQSRSGTTKALTSAVTTAKCPSCHESHALYQCTNFKSLSTDKRKTLAKQYQVCFNCLHKGHFPAKCPSHNRCKRCQQKHHTLLHDDAGYNTNKVDESTNKANNSTAESSVSESISKSSVSLKVSVDQTVSLRKRSVLMATARILVCTDAGRKLCLRALIDTGSFEATFITERAAQALKVKRQKTHIQVSGLDGQPSGVVQYNTKLTLKSCSSQEGSVVVTALILPNLTSYHPTNFVNKNDYAHLQDLHLADSNPSSRERIDVLIGADIYGLILLNGLRKGTKDAPVAQRTIFGWILFGSCIKDDNMNYKVTTSLQCSITPSVDSLLRSFWEVEELVLPSALSSDDKICEQHFVSTYTRLASGRYVVRLPFKPSCKKDLGESYYLASKSLDRLEHRLSRNVKLSEAYQKFLHEYESLGHMAPLTLSEIAMKPNYYLPHHSVVKESSTSPVRVVFNASSASSNGVSLNDCLLTGPKLQTDLPSIILRWRMHRLVLVADIAKMYRQIMIHPDDTNYQRIIWRPNPDQPVEHYRLLTITYGMASAPFLAMRVLQQLCADEGAQYPLATPILHDSTYVDDILLGGDDVSTIQETRKQLNSLLQSGGFHLRKWTSNYEELLRDIPTVDRLDLNNVTFSESFITKVLGVAWNPTSDSFNFNNSLPTSPGSTKRCVLSTIARFFDPLGWITPIVISAKIFMQELWIRRVDSNSTLPGDLRDWWNSYYHSLFELRHITIPRWTRQSSSDLGVELHGFADASTRAYAAVVYIRILSSLDYFHTTLIISKSKVAPIKTISIPRLELCAAVLLTRIIAFVQRILKSPETPVYCWSDSMITLAWIKQHPSSWKTFIANRVSEIQTSLPQAKWRYINSANNPADCASRGRYFDPEIRAIKHNNCLSKSSKLKNLNPFIDNKGILRVGGRLNHASLTYDEKHPIILPRHRLSELIVDQIHKQTLHGGPQLTLRVLRQKFWILNARNLVKGHIHRCIPCTRQRAVVTSQIMSDLPSNRVNPSRSFQHSGVDYAGPIQILTKVGRGQKPFKAYIAVFICLATRAIHLELVHNYSSEGFIAAFRRFTARRGIPSTLLSDNGTNFYGAERELSHTFKSLSRNPDLIAYFANDRIEWKFIPPSAPHFGGIWEAGVKSVKHHLRRVVGTHTLSIEEFVTLLTQIEACLNSRPIAPLSDDPSDLTSLTPGHFLVGGPLVTIPEESLLDLKETRLNRWQRVQRMYEQFWRIWSKDYLHSLQQRHKWQYTQVNLKPNEIVLVRNDLLPPSKWELGRVMSTYPDDSGQHSSFISLINCVILQALTISFSIKLTVNNRRTFMYEASGMFGTCS
ncbi:uncharacterized protein [Linepithema humile]|uniref:uncharacterized protein n=1 Tax=Linepithema humile TaxID=83485 RepID=UPI00351F026A